MESKKIIEILENHIKSILTKELYAKELYEQNCYKLEG